MRERSANIILWTEAIFWMWFVPLFRQYLIYSGIVFNAFVLFLLIWR